MVHFSLFKSLTPYLTLPFTLFSAVLAPLTLASPGVAIDDNYGQCATDLLEAGLSRDVVAAACASALRPEQVSTCVLDVTAATELSAESALAACSRDRRPLEVASCVVNIHNALAVSNSAAVLNHCHRSILPVRYGTCVVETALITQMATDDSLALCLAAGYRPVDVAPSFIPAR
ncbi:MAG: hypothetical protein VKI82_04265 [Leptolyngbya sp.]|nr:hypothetical protein [Leptolyngbya sp.]